MDVPLLRYFCSRSWDIFVDVLLRLEWLYLFCGCCVFEIALFIFVLFNRKVSQHCIESGFLRQTLSCLRSVSSIVSCFVLGCIYP